MRRNLSPVTCKGGDGTALFSVEVVHLVDGVEMAAIGRERQEAGVHSGRRQAEWRHGARVSIPTKPVDASAGALFCVGAGKNESSRWGGPSADGC